MVPMSPLSDLNNLKLRSQISWMRNGPLKKLNKQNPGNFLSNSRQRLKLSQMKLCTTTASINLVRDLRVNFKMRNLMSTSKIASTISATLICRRKNIADLSSKKLRRKRRKNDHRMRRSSTLGTSSLRCLSLNST